MDLKILREQAIKEANDDFSEKKVNEFKQKIKTVIWQISENNAGISELQETNKKLAKKLNEYELEEFKSVNV